MVGHVQPFGVVNVDKPLGTTSRRVVDRVQRVLRDAGWSRKEARAGHAGTLDPLATGVLVVCVGPATRLISLVQDQPKTYRARFRLGATSNTDDLEGEIVPVDVAVLPDESRLRSAVDGFVGEIEQTPPAFSAVHVDGRRAYERARRGEDVELEPRRVSIHAIDVLAYKYPTLSLEITCGGGTYIRSIGRDLGRVLGCGGLMTGLVRTRIGPFTVDDAAPLDSLDVEAIRPPDPCVAHLPHVVCDESEVRLIAQGRAIVRAGITTPGEDRRVAMFDDDGLLLAIGEFDANEHRVAPRHVFIRP